MSRSPKTPPDAVIFTAYGELQKLAQAFMSGGINCIILLGKPGIGKSKCFELLHAANPTKSAILNGKGTPMATYRECYFHRHQLLVFDDSDSLWGTGGDNGKTIMRQIGTDRPMKRMQWLTSSKQLAEWGVPQQFDTASKSCFLLNRFVATKDDFYDAIISRGHFYYFDPSVHTIHEFAATILPSAWQHIHDYVGQHLDKVKPEKFDLRVYGKLAELEAAGLDWKQYFHDAYCQEDVLSAVRRYEMDNTLPDTAAKVAAFVKAGLGSRSTYFAKKAILTAEGILRPASPIILTGKPPETVDMESLRKEIEQEQEEEEEADEDADGDTQDKSDTPRKPRSPRNKRKADSEPQDKSDTPKPKKETNKRKAG